MQARMLLVFLAAMAHGWFIQLMPTKTHRALPAELVPSQSVPSMWYFKGFILPKCRFYPC